MFKDFLISVVYFAFIHVLCGVIVPEGKMKKIVLSIISIVLFYGIVSSVVEIFLKV